MQLAACSRWHVAQGILFQLCLRRNGCLCRPPLLGFAELKPKLRINMRGHVGNDDDERALPSASTCFNLLRLPPYRDDETLRAQVLYAIEAGLTFDLS